MQLYEKERSGMLADMGYVGFAADIYGVGTPTATMKHWMAAANKHRGNSTLYMAKIQAAITKVKSYDYVDSTKIAVIGYCFGGTGIVNMAILGSDVLGVVGYHSGIAPEGRVHVNSTTPLKITAKVLLHSGAMDDKAADVAMLEQELENASATYEIVRYGKDVFHSFTEWSSKVPGQAMYNARADYRSWESTKMFLHELFKGMPTPAKHVADVEVAKSLHNYTCANSDDKCGTMQGYLAYKTAGCTATKKCPVVVVIQDWNGMNKYEKERSDMLAGMDYVAFAADIYGYGTPVEKMSHWVAASGMHRGNPALYYKKIQAAIDKVKTLDFVDVAKIAVIGYCFGGTGVINMAIQGSNVLGVVGYHSGLTGRVMYNMGKDKAPAVTAKLLIHSGVMDDKATDIAALEQDLEKANATYEIARYGNKVYHSFTEWSSNVPGMAMYNARADYRSWESTKLFLHELFKGMPTPAKSHTGGACNGTGGGKAAETTVSGSFEVTMKKEQVAKVLSNPTAKAALESKLAIEIAAAAGAGISAAHVAVTVSASSRRLTDGRRLASEPEPEPEPTASTAGSLLVAYTIKVPASVGHTSVATKINSKTPTNLKDIVNSALTAASGTVPELKGVAATGVTVKTTADAATLDGISTSGTTMSSQAMNMVTMLMTSAAFLMF